MFTNSKKYKDILDKFDGYTKDAASFLRSQEYLEHDVKCLLKDTYDVMTQTKYIDKSENQSLTKLLIKDFDTEQIWQQLELFNCANYDKLKQNVLQINKHRHALHDFLSQTYKAIKSVGSNNEADEKCGKNNNDETETEDSDEHETIPGNNCKVENDSNDSDDDEYHTDNRDEMEEENVKKFAHKSSSVVDDDFFKLSEMEQFLLSEEKTENNRSNTNDSEFIDYFRDIPDSEEENTAPDDKVKYSDFFENPDAISKKRRGSKERTTSKKRVKFFDDISSNCEDDDEVDPNFESVPKDENSDIQSSYEQRKKRIGEHIEKLQDEIIDEKPWQMKGEITAKKRPQNSLLEEVLEFNLTTRPAPIITEEVTLKLEDIILRRIKDKAWDDVERKIKPVETPYEFKKKLILNQEKSKLSLAEIYEKEYLKQRDEVKSKSKNNQLEDEEPAEHKRIKSLIDVMFKKLDALSNYHFTPMPVAPKIDIINNLPAISMEEAAPVSVSDAVLLAPEEIQEKSNKGEPVNKMERTTTDKKRDRRKKKLKQRERRKQMETKEKLLKRLNVGMGNKYSKEKVQKELEQLSKMQNVGKLEEKLDSKKHISSKAFFGMLNETSAVNSVNKKKKKNSKPGVTVDHKVRT